MNKSFNATPPFKPFNDQPTLIYWLYGYTLIGSVSLFGHALVACTIMRHSTLNYLPYQLLLNQGVFNIGYSFVSMIIAILAVHNNSLFIMTCAEVLARVTFIGSILIMCCMAFDRVLAVKYTLTYQFFARRKAPVAMILFSWMTSILLSILMAIGNVEGSNQDVPIQRSGYIVLSLTITLSSLFVGLCLIYIYSVSSSQLSSLRKTTKYLHGKMAEKCASLKKRQMINYDVTVVSLITIAILIPDNVLYLKLYMAPSIEDKKILLLIWGMGAIYCAVNPFVYLKVMRKLHHLFSTDVALITLYRKNVTHNKVAPGLTAEATFTKPGMIKNENENSVEDQPSAPSVFVVELCQINIERAKPACDSASSHSSTLKRRKPKDSLTFEN